MGERKVSDEEKNLLLLSLVVLIMAFSNTAYAITPGELFKKYENVSYYDLTAQEYIDRFNSKNGSSGARLIVDNRENCYLTIGGENLGIRLQFIDKVNGPITTASGVDMEKWNRLYAYYVSDDYAVNADLLAIITSLCPRFAEIVGCEFTEQDFLNGCEVSGGEFPLMRYTKGGIENEIQYRDASVDSLHQRVYSFSITLLQENLIQSKNDEPNASAQPAEASHQNLKVGDEITFGSYEQDNDPANGAEEIKWLVLTKEGNRALLISKYALDCQPYHEKYSDITWENCTLRTWLNDTFLNSAFSEEEKATITATTVSAEDNTKYSIPAGNSTEDQVFLLSISELDEYFASDEKRTCTPTAYAVERGCLVNNDCCICWSRSPGSLLSCAAMVLYNGIVVREGNGVGTKGFAVRPAMWIDLSLSEYVKH